MEDVSCLKVIGGHIGIYQTSYDTTHWIIELWVRAGRLIEKENHKFAFDMNRSVGHLLNTHIGFLIIDTVKYHCLMFYRSISLLIPNLYFCSVFNNQSLVHYL